jgi:sarcosine oxidase, subunit beta
LFTLYNQELEDSLRSLLPTQHKMGLEIDFVPPERVKELVPGINPEGLRGGIYSPNDGMATPYLAAQSFYKHAKQNGVSA